MKMKMNKHNNEKKQQIEKTQKMREKETNQSAVKNSTKQTRLEEQQLNVVTTQLIPVDLSTIAKSIEILSKQSGWIQEPITPSLLKRLSGMWLTSDELCSGINELKAKGYIVQHPENDWQYRIADAYIIAGDDGDRLLLLDIDDHPQTRWQSIILSRMKRNGLPPELKMLYNELFCVTDVIFKTNGMAPINPQTLWDVTHLLYSETEIQLFLKELIRLKVIVEHPFEHRRYEISKQYLLTADGVTSLLVAPIQDSKSRNLFLVRERIRRSGLKLDIDLPIIVSALKFCVMNALHLKIMFHGACKTLTPEEALYYSHAFIDQSEIDTILDEFCTNGIIIKNASGRMRIADRWILRTEGIWTLLIVPPEDQAKW